MAEARKPDYRIAIAGPQGRRVAELYPARLFPGGNGEDLYRVRVDRAWYMPGGRKYCFLSLAEALAVAGWPREDAPRPDLRKGDRRRILLGKAEDGAPLYESVVAMTPPFQGPDLRWRVFLVGREEPVLVQLLSR